MLDQINKAHIYVDTIQISIPLKQKMGSIIDFQREVKEKHPSMGKRVQLCRAKKAVRNWRQIGWYLTIHQPNIKDIHELTEKYLIGPFKVRMVDVALDWECDNPKQLGTWVQARICLTYHSLKKSSPINRCKDTQYHGRANDRCNLASYADKPQRFTGQPCVHMELRYSGVDACRIAGFVCILDAADQKLLWDNFSSRVRLYEVLEAKLDDALTVVAKRVRKIRMARGRTAQTIPQIKNDISDYYRWIYWRLYSVLESPEF